MRNAPAGAEWFWAGFTCQSKQSWPRARLGEARYLIFSRKLTSVVIL